jgi:hypothetical protein
MGPYWDNPLRYTDHPSDQPDADECLGANPYRAGELDLWLVWDLRPCGAVNPTKIKLTALVLHNIHTPHHYLYNSLALHKQRRQLCSRRLLGTKRNLEYEKESTERTR